MRKITASVLFALCLGLIVPPVIAQQNKLSPAEEAAGWKLLFDPGQKDAHWRNGEKGTTLKWIVEEGALTNPGGDICTRETFDNYEYAVDWKVNKGGNSGIFWRVDPATGWFKSGPEYALLDNVNGGDRSDIKKRAGANYDMQMTTRTGHPDSPFVDVSKPFGEYNKTVLWMNGNFVEHWLNGEKVVDYEILSDLWKKQFAASKFRDYPKWGRFAQGLICMQDHGGGHRVWFANIKIRPFKPGEKLPKPYMTPGGGNHKQPLTVTLDPAVTGATVIYTTDGSEPSPSSKKYVGPITLNATQTIKARTYRDKFPASDVAAATYTLSGTGPSRIASATSQFSRASVYAAGQVEWMLPLPEEKPYAFQLIGANGRVLLHFQAQGPGKAAMPVGNLQRGFYFLKVESPGLESSLERIFVF